MPSSFWNISSWRRRNRRPFFIRRKMSNTSDQILFSVYLLIVLSLLIYYCQNIGDYLEPDHLLSISIYFWKIATSGTRIRTLPSIFAKLIFFCDAVNYDSRWSGPSCMSAIHSLFLWYMVFYAAELILDLQMLWSNIFKI